MKRGLSIALVLAVFGFLVAILFRAFGHDPHAVPFGLAGKKAPDFTIARLDNSAKVSLAQFAGRPLVINFWATWCVPCQVEHPVLAWAADAYRDKVSFLGIVFEDTENATRDFLAKHGDSYLQLFDPTSTVAVDYGVAGVPETYFINRDGIIVAKYAAPFSDRALFKSYLERILP